MTDEELVYLMREKNEDAESIFMKKYENVIQRISFTAVGYFAHDNEVKSTAYFVLMQCVQSYDEKLNNLFITYYNTCLRNRLKSLLRRYHYGEKNQWIHTYQDITEMEVKDYTLHDPLQQYIVEEQKTEVLAYLNVIEKAVFHKTIEGYNSAEIAMSENVPIKKVYNTIYKVKKMLKK